MSIEFLNGYLNSLLGGGAVNFKNLYNYVINARQKDSFTVFSVDRLILQKKVSGRKRNEYKVLNGKELSSARNNIFHNLPTNTTVNSYLHFCLPYIFACGDYVETEWEVVGVDFALDLLTSDTELFRHELLTRLATGSYVSSSKELIAQIDSFLRYKFYNSPAFKEKQIFSVETYDVLKNSFLSARNLPVSDLLADRAYLNFKVPSDFYFGKKHLKRSRINSTNFSFDLDIYDKYLKEKKTIYSGIMRFEIRLRGLTDKTRENFFPLNKSSSFESLFVLFDKSLSIRKRPSRRLVSTSFKNVYKWPLDDWWFSVRDRLVSNVFLLDPFMFQYFVKDNEKHL